MQTKLTGQNHILRIITLTLFAFSVFQLAGVGALSQSQTNEIMVTGQTALVGLGRGEMMRYTAFNPLTTESGRPNESISLRLKLFDAQGNVITESPAMQIPPGEFRSVDFNHEDLPIAGEPGTERKQIRTQPLWGVRQRSTFHVSTSLETVDTTTGGSFKFFFTIEALP